MRPRDRNLPPTRGDRGQHRRSGDDDVSAARKQGRQVESIEHRHGRQLHGHAPSVGGGQPGAMELLRVVRRKPQRQSCNGGHCADYADHVHHPRHIHLRQHTVHRLLGRPPEIGEFGVRRGIGGQVALEESYAAHVDTDRVADAAIADHKLRGAAPDIEDEDVRVVWDPAGGAQV